MAREGSSQEVGCVVALSTALYHGLVHRRSATGATNNNSNTSNAATMAAAASRVDSEALPREVGVPGVILEVRHLWTPSTALSGNRGNVSSSGTMPAATAEADAARATTTLRGTDDPLYAFVRVKETDHRLSGWFPAHQVYVKSSAAVPAFGDAFTDAAAVAGAVHGASHNAMDASGLLRGVTDDMTALSHLLRRPWLSNVYEEVTPGMARTQRARRQLDYLEERLLRDCRTPTTVRYFVYLNTYIFAPWYYAPFGLLNSEYDPMLPLTAETAHGSLKGTIATASNASSPPWQSSTYTSAVSGASQQPFIRDAFLCPFSLRIFSTYAQLHYETRTYRAGQLRPPGEEIYRDEVRGLSLFKIDGSQHVTYCRHLFLIGKSFLENKLAGHDVHSYHFYVVCLHHRYFPEYVSDTSAMYFAGFFTWEKQVREYNLACIATLPCFGRQVGQRRPADGSGSSSLPSHGPPPVLRNIGQFMIAVSYELAYRRQQIGTPEKPLSDLGAVAYQHFWRRALVRWMKETLNSMRWSVAVDVDGLPNEGDGNLAAEQSSSGNTNGATEAAAAAVSRRVRLALPSHKRRRDAEDANDGSATVDGEGRRTGEKDKAVPSTSPLPLGQAVQVISVVGSSSPASTSSSPPLPSAFAEQTTIKEIAAAVRLEETDVLKTLLGMGVLHRNSEDRSTILLLPQRYVDWMYDEMLRWESSTANAVFQPALLKSR